MEMARQREEYAWLRLIYSVQQIECYGFHRALKREADAKEVQRVKSSAAKISIPGTPRRVGVGAGTRLIQTPRKRGGI